MRQKTPRWAMVTLSICAAVAPASEAGQAATRDTKNGPAPTILSGTITDQVGRGVEGALVRWTRGAKTELGSTDEDGHYAFAIPPEGGGKAASPVEVAVRANVFAETNKSVQLEPGRTTNADFKLVRKPANQIATVQGSVNDSNGGDGVAGVEVRITNAGGELRAVTDRDGKYVIGNVGFASDLKIEISTRKPPCVARTERSFSVAQAVVEQSFSLPQVYTGRLTCPAKAVAATRAALGESIEGATGREMDDVREAAAAKSAAESFSRGTGWPAPPGPSTLHWTQADNETIHTGVSPDVWNAGHVNDLVVLKGGEIVVGTDTGGIWSVGANGTTQPLTRGATFVNINSLAQGPDSIDHFYAGTYWSQQSPGGGVLLETDTSATLFVLLTWAPVNPGPSCGEIYKVLTVGRKIVLACDSGVWWSNIPKAPSVHGTYDWKAATGLGSGVSGGFTGLALGPAANGDGVIAAGQGGSAPHNAIFYGSWTKDGNLAFEAATVEVPKGKDSLKLGRISVASCAVDVTQVYAVAADKNNVNMEGIWLSSDGGHKWSRVSTPSQPGQQGGYNNVMAVAPDCHAAAVGWQNGTFVTYNGGKSWNALVDTSQGQYSDLHADVHGLEFDPNSPTTLYIGSDGGVASASFLVQGSTPTFKSSYNHTLMNLQMYHAGASFQTDGLVTAALQDNGVLYSHLPNGWWHVTDCGCDGGGTKFAGTSKSGPGSDFMLEGEFSGSAYPWNWETSQPHGSPTYGFDKQQTIPDGTNPNGVSNPANQLNTPLGIVRFPTYKNKSGQLMYALAAANQKVYGLFISGDGGNPHWDKLGSVGSGDGQTVSAVASYDGTDVLVGTTKGNIYQFIGPYPNGAIHQAIQRPPGGGPSINGLVEISPGAGAGIYNTGGQGYFVLQTNEWQAAGSATLPNALNFNAIEISGPPGGKTTLYVTNGGSVYSSDDSGSTWKQENDGLPTVCNGNDLQAVTQSDGKKYLYLATYGWSLWRAELP